MDRLPEDLLAEILRRLPPRPLAVCRSVSKHLRAVIDIRGLLLAVAHRVPRGLRGIFINFTGQDRPYFFSRPADSAIDVGLSFVPRIRWGEVVHHCCNGLLLVQEDWKEVYVCNPATRRCEHLPPPPWRRVYPMHLLFDPTVSLHYEVFYFAQEVPRKPKIPIQPDIERPLEFQDLNEYTTEEIELLPSSLRAEYDREARIKGSVEWPPSSYVAHVFSSRTGKWERRVCVREDDVAVTLFDVWSDPTSAYGGRVTYAASASNHVYWRGAIYLHCRGGFVMRLSLSEQKYQVIKTPKLDNVFVPPRLDIDEYLSKDLHPYEMSKEEYLSEFQLDQKSLDKLQPSMHLGKSEHGIYYTAVRWHQLQVWVLREASESRPMPEWELKYKADIKPSSFLQHYTRVDTKKNKACWMLDCGQIGSENNRKDCGWDSSDDSGINAEEEHTVDKNAPYCGDFCPMDFLGYHPSKEIVFLANYFDGFAYYLGSSKLEYLGKFRPVGGNQMGDAYTDDSFIYTPCMDDLLPANNMNLKDGGVEDEDISEDEDINEDEDISEDEDTSEDEDLEVEDEDFEF